MNSGFFPLLKSFLLFSALMLAVSGCGSSGATADKGSGAVAVKLVWSATSGTPQAAAKALLLAPAGVITVRIIVSGADMTAIQQDFPAADGSGVVDGIPSGTGRTVTAQGLDSNGLVIWQGETLPNIEIKAGVATDAGIITLQQVGSISGKVTDLQGGSQGVANAVVGLYLSGKRVATTTTDSSGNYAFNGIYLFQYKITFGRNSYSYVWYNTGNGTSLRTPTLVQAPASGINGFLSAVVTATPSGGHYPVDTFVTLSSSTGRGAIIYYTTNGQDPTLISLQGNSPIRNILISGANTILKYFAIYTNGSIGSYYDPIKSDEYIMP